MTLPMRLFHYTTIEALAHILESREIRFSKLSQVNDPKEGISDDYGNFSQYIFVSCWTDQAEENIALWNIYTPIAHGVRLEMSFPILKQVDSNTGLLVADSDVLKDGYILAPNLESITKVEYTGDETLFCPKILAKNTIQPGLLGKYKSDIWKFESEYRYILFGIPLKNQKSKSKISVADYSNAISERLPLPVEYIFMEIDPYSFNSMIITLGPRLSDGEKIIVRALVNSLNSSAQIIESTLKSHYR